MIARVPIERWHFLAIRVQPCQEFEKIIVLTNLDAGLEAMAQHWDWCYTVLDDAEVLAIAGGYDFGTHGEAWSLLSADIGPRMPRVFREVKRSIQRYTLTGKPLYVNVNPAHEEAVRWAKLIGLKYTGQRDIWCYTSTGR